MNSSASSPSIPMTPPKQVGTSSTQQVESMSNTSDFDCPGAPGSLDLPVVLLVAGDEFRETTAGSPPLPTPVARDAREGMPPVLVGSTGPSVADGHDSASTSPRPPSVIQPEGDRQSQSIQPINNTAPIRADEPPTMHPASSTRLFVDLSSTSYKAAPRATPAGPETMTYAFTLKRAIEKSHEGEVKASLTRSSTSMLTKLLALADDDSVSDDAMFAAIGEALPYPKRIGLSTFWITTGIHWAQNQMTKLSNAFLKKTQRHHGVLS
ncbi:hypothetical protein AC1031_011285 [Aphanomyces cochlioides]|nr:hypothetical protein AC1031_011285 [Aphanomyces cochlioides]